MTKKQIQNAQTAPEIRREERRRADNQIWNAARDYGFRSSVRMYDESGAAELYWNSIIGAAEKQYGRDLDLLWQEIHKAIAEDLCEQLAWLGIEHACFERESRLRPALPLLRESFAKKVLEQEQISLPYPYNEVYRLHFQAEIETEDGKEAENAWDNAKDPDFNKRSAQKGPSSTAFLQSPEEALQNSPEYIRKELAFSGDLSGTELAEAILCFLDRRTLLLPGEKEAERSRLHIHLPFLKKGREGVLPPVRSFGGGALEHADPFSETGKDPEKHRISDMSLKKSETVVASYIRDVFGTPLLNGKETEKIERLLCCGEHAGCHLYFAAGDGQLKEGLSGYAGASRKKAIQQMKRNRSFYERNRTQVRLVIRQLTERWKNAFLTWRQDNAIRSCAGKLRTDRVWRAPAVKDDRVFDRVIPADQGGYQVDLLLDGSLSQRNRQEIVALQGYMIAESLTGCGIPVRVSSFSTMTGYTILTQFRDYGETDANERIFNYTTAGGNRDGLALSAAGYLMDQQTDHPDHRILILLSDAHPDDGGYMQTGSETVPYRDEASVLNTAKEVRYLKNRGICVLCVFTGSEEDLPNARQIYNRDFVRIRDLDHFAQAVGNLMLTQISE